MNIKLVLAGAVVCALGVLLMAGNASAQWSGSIVVSNRVEPAPAGMINAGVSAARCGASVVVGFGDTETNNTRSFDGVSVSHNGGATFTDVGVLPVPPPSVTTGSSTVGSDFSDPNGPNNPAVACANSSVFYYASVYGNTGELCSNQGGGCTAISVSKSTNGGTTWGLPVIASIQGSDIFDFVSPSIAVDPTNASRLYAAYIDVDMTSNFFHDCDFRSYSLDIVRSSDGGKTWNGPLRVDHACDSLGANAALTGRLRTPSIIVSPGGKIYVVDEFVGQSGNPNAIHFLRSTDLGNSFSAPISVSTKAANNASPQLAVDRTGLRSRGEIYLTWSGSPTGTYTDILVSDSVNFGVSFSFPRPISPAPAAGTGRFQTNAVIAVDNDGQVADCFYDTPTNSPTSSSVYSYNCAASFNNAASWQTQRILSSVPAGFDAATSDFSLLNDGFFTAFELQTSTQRWVVGRKADQ